jgi:hypothetical protein
VEHYTTIGEWAASTSQSYSSVRRQVACGDLPARRVGRHWLIPLEAADFDPTAKDTHPAYRKRCFAEWDKQMVLIAACVRQQLTGQPQPEIPALAEAAGPGAAAVMRFAEEDFAPLIARDGARERAVWLGITPVDE